MHAYCLYNHLNPDLQPLLPNHLINNGFLRTTCEYKLILALKGKQVPSRYVRVVLSLQPPLGWSRSVLVTLKLHHLLPGTVDAPLAEVVVATDAVDGGLVGAELDVEDFTAVSLPTAETLLLKHV